MGKRKFWQFRSAAGSPEVGELVLYGEIADTTWFGDEVTPRQFYEDLKALGDIKQLNVYINSPGGDAFAGQAIYSMLKRHPAKVTVYIDGLAASAASLVAMAGDRIIIPRNGMMMVHNPWVIAAGDAAFLRQVADELDKAREAMIPVYEARTGLSREKIIELLDAETWMTAEEAVELGFADEIEEAKQVAASVRGSTLVVNGVEVDLSRFRNPPKIATAQNEPVTVTLNVDTKKLAKLVLEHLGIKAGVVPEDVSRKKAPEDEPWEAPDLEDFTDKSWGELSDDEKRRIAGHFAWAPEIPPERFTDLKLPHHRPTDGAVVLRGVIAAAQRLDQTDIPEEDKEKVRRHLESHYHQFGRKAPWEEDDAGDKSNKLKLLKLEFELLTGQKID